MSWASTAAALVSRIQAVVPMAKVHPYIRNTRFDANHEEFQAAYVSCFGQVQVIQVTRSALRQAKSIDDDGRWIEQHDVQLQLLTGLEDCRQSEIDFQATLESICSDLRTGDKSLGGVAHTLSDPQVSDIGHAMLAEQVLCHYAIIRLTIEEIV